jgi:hypothetical protein
MLSAETQASLPLLAISLCPPEIHLTFPGQWSFSAGAYPEHSLPNHGNVVGAEPPAAFAVPRSVRFH